MSADCILHKRQDRQGRMQVPSFVEALAIKDGKIGGTGTSEEILRQRGPATTVIDANGRTVIPGLNDSHLHLIRSGGLQLQPGTPLGTAFRVWPTPCGLLRDQARAHARSPMGAGGRQLERGFQFAERRMPTLDEINAVAPSHAGLHPASVRPGGFLNRSGSACGCCGYDKDTPNPPGGENPVPRASKATRPVCSSPTAQCRDPVCRLAGRKGRSCHRSIRRTRRGNSCARNQPSRRHQRRHRRRGRFSKLPGRLPGNRGVAPGAAKMTVRIAYNLFTQHPQAGTLRRLLEVGPDDQARRRRRLLPHEWGGRDVDVLGGGL